MEEQAKIQLKNGKILTLKISHETLEFLEGTDKFGQAVLIPKDELRMRIPISGVQHE